MLDRPLRGDIRDDNHRIKVMTTTSMNLRPNLRRRPRANPGRLCNDLVLAEELADGDYDGFRGKHMTAFPNHADAAIGHDAGGACIGSRVFDHRHVKANLVRHLVRAESWPWRFSPSNNPLKNPPRLPPRNAPQKTSETSFAHQYVSAD